MATTFIQFWSKLIPNAQKPNFIPYKSLEIPANNLEEEPETAGKNKEERKDLWKFQNESKEERSACG
jgi:hypothetical protein